MPATIVSDAQALTILRQANDKTFDAAARAESAQQGNVVAQKAVQFGQAAIEAHAEQKDSIAKFGSNMVGMGLNYKASLYGNSKPDIRQMKAEADAAFAARMAEAKSNRLGANTLAQNGGVADSVGKAYDAMSQNLGPQEQVQAAKVAQKVSEADESVAKNMLEGAKANKEQAAKAIDATNEVAKGFIERAKQVIDRAFGG